MLPSAILLLLIAAGASHLLPAAGRHGAAGACEPRERDALLAFKQSITGDPAGRLASWHEGEQDCCRWGGVWCSNSTGRQHVVGLDLRNMVAYDPELDPTGTALVGQISPSLVSLHHLEHLDLSLNNISGPTGRVPEFIGLLGNLKYLNLSCLPFSGSLPPQLGNLSKLQYLDLSQNGYFSLWELYSTDISWLSNLPLRYLNMETIDLSKIVNWARVMNTVPSLKVLLLPFCSLTSANESLPHLNLTDLQDLSLSYNAFDHPVASCWFWNLTGLLHLELSRTHLYGHIPGMLGGMTSLQVLDFSNSYGAMDIMMANMKNLCSLEILDLSGSNFNGDIVELFERLPRQLKELYLGYSNFGGILPNWIGQWPSLLVIDLSYNYLTGPVPSEISMLSNLTNMDLSYNNLSGVITHGHFAGLARLRSIDLSQNNDLKILMDPHWLPPFRLEYASFAYCDMGPLFPLWLQSQVDIRTLDISNTYISDRLPNWFVTTFSKATDLYISNNRINGTLPTNLENMTSLQVLKLNSNQITGQIPHLPKNLSSLDISGNYISGTQSICQLNLGILNLANNFLEGEFPQCSGPRMVKILVLNNNILSGKLESILKTYTELEILDLAWNKFTGSIPATITKLGGLYNLNLAGNSISGTLPRHLLKLMNMKRDEHVSITHDMDVNVSVTMKGQEHYYYDESEGMVSIDLSSNHLTGGIPEEIFSLDGVVNLNLSRNHLSGFFSEKIGIMYSLESLDLSQNNIYGEIPQSLSNLTFLSYMDLSFNNLTGRIPKGIQLDTLYMQYPFIYDGNNGLCGHPLQKNCNDNGKPKPSNDQERDGHDSSKVLPFSTGLGVGYVVGLWLVFCAFLFKKAWRVAYFCLFDKACI